MDPKPFMSVVSDEVDARWIGRKADLDLRRVPRAVVHVATSPPLLQVLAGVLATAAGRDVPLLVLDVQVFAPELQGTLWIKDGKTVNALKTFSKNDAARIVAFTQELLPSPF